MNPEYSQNKENSLKEIIKFTIIALAIVIPIRAYIAQPFIVSGPSMDPTFSSGQYLIVDQVSYDFIKPKRDEVIVFKYPKDISTYFIKRIIGLPGESVYMDGGVITIKNNDNPNGFRLDEPYITNEHKTSDTFEVTLGPKEYFVMGDNRPQSSDSRTWGPLDSNLIVGRPILRLLPFSKISLFPGR